MFRRMKAWAVLVALAITGIGFISPSPAQAAYALPGGHANYVMGLIVSKPNTSETTASFVRLSEWQLKSDGTLTESYWAWNSGMAKAGDKWAERVKVATTNGCAQACGVWTAKGFDKNASVRSGKWRPYSVSGSQYIEVTWSSGIIERHKVTQKRGLTELQLWSHTYPGASHAVGRGYGSNQPFTAAKTAAQIKSSGVNITGTATNYWEQQWGKALAYKRQNFNFGATESCSSSNCLRNSVRTAQHIYLYGHSGTRKISWYNMLNSMVKGENLCIPADQGGHQLPSLQIIDDQGNFRGMIAVEASLYGRTAPSNFLALASLVSE